MAGTVIETVVSGNLRRIAEFSFGICGTRCLNKLHPIEVTGPVLLKHDGIDVSVVVDANGKLVVDTLYEVVNADVFINELEDDKTLARELRRIFHMPDGKPEWMAIAEAHGWRPPEVTHA